MKTEQIKFGITIAVIFVLFILIILGAPLISQFPSSPVGKAAPTVAPANLTGIAGNGQVILTWDSVQGATYYQIWKNVYPTTPLYLHYWATATTYTVTNLTNGTKYYFSVKACNGDGCGPLYEPYLELTPYANPDTTQTECDRLFGATSCGGSTCYNSSWPWNAMTQSNGTYYKNCCGDDSQEHYNYFRAFDSETCNQTGGCSGTSTSDAECCTQNNSCIYQGVCYDSGAILDVDGTGKNEAICVFDSETQESVWYDLDIGGALTFCWMQAGYKAIKAGEISVGEYTDTTTIECCGDDSGEYYIVTGSNSACCNNATDTVNSSNQCVSSGPVCPNGSCETGETYSSCPNDCCDEYCTSTTDDICHSECNGKNGCTIITGANGLTRGTNFCSNGVPATACETLKTACTTGQTCVNGTCQTTTTCLSGGTPSGSYCQCSGSSTACITDNLKAGKNVKLTSTVAGNLTLNMITPASQTLLECNSGIGIGTSPATQDGLTIAAVSNITIKGCIIGGTRKRVELNSDVTNVIFTNNNFCGSAQASMGDIQCNQSGIALNGSGNTCRNDFIGMCTVGSFSCTTCGNCGNGTCDSGETYANCAKDCCNNCTAITDNICHSLCSGKNNCVSFYAGADGVTKGQSFCTSSTQSAIACGGTITNCSSGQTCTNGTCVAAPSTCSDGVKNGTETDIDCGGSCPTCVNGLHCSINSDCFSNNCVSGTCTAITAGCSDGIKNGTESDIDCGGSCTDCGNEKHCNSDSDCSSNNCVAGICKAQTTSECGNDEIDSGEDCEPKNDSNNDYCGQTKKKCDLANRKYGYRDSYGNCDSSCQCEFDEWLYDSDTTVGSDYCEQCAHCGDNSCNCNESKETCATDCGIPTDNTAPSKPTGLTVTEKDKSIELNWKDNAESDLDYYKVYYGTASGNYSQQLTAASSEKTIAGLTNGTKYFLAITAIDKSGNESLKSAEGNGSPHGISASLTPPANVVGNITEGKIRIQWNAVVPKPDKYLVYKKLSSENKFEKIGETSQLSIIVSDAERGQQLDFTVTSFKDGEESQFSNQFSIQVPICNNNDECEAGTGEDFSNCPNDCSIIPTDEGFLLNIGLSIVIVIICIALAFVYFRG